MLYSMEAAYLDLLRRCLQDGDPTPTRTKFPTRSLFGAQIRTDLRAGFPLLTTKRIPFRLIVEELRWFLSGSTNRKDLSRRGVTIWDEWGDESGELGPVYGHQWRNFGGGVGEPCRVVFLNGDKRNPVAIPAARGVDQIARVVDDIRAVIADPRASVGRRLVVSAWNPVDVPRCALPPCHMTFQFSVRPPRPRGDYYRLDDSGKPTGAPISRAALLAMASADVDGSPVREHFAAVDAALANQLRELSCHMYMRSADIFLGVPFNIASYALLTHLIAKVCGLDVGDLVISFGDVHLYENHVEQARTQLARAPYEPPRLMLAGGDWTLADLCSEDLIADLFLDGYQSHPKIDAEVAV
jgi:thymidylate synthase